MELWSKNNVIYTIGKIYTCICKNKVISPFFFYKPTRIFSLLPVKLRFPDFFIIKLLCFKEFTSNLRVAFNQT